MSNTKQRNRAGGETGDDSKGSLLGRQRSAGLSSRRRWIFRLTALFLLPVVILLLLEAGLRLAGFGYPTSFFVTKQIQGRKVLVENDQFGLRFFPPQLARSPSPLVMPADKPPGTCRIFILGESAALGDPEPAFGFGRFLKVLLQQRFPHQNFEVVCTAMTAINSHAILPIARDCAKHQGDIWVVYMGNNEFVGPFGPATVFGPQTPPLSLIRLGLALKKTRIGQLLYQVASRRPDQKTWGGMKMFLEHQVPPTDPRKQKVYDFFQANLEDMLAAARGGGAKVILSTVAANLKDCSPFASQNSESLEGNEKTRWQQFYAGGIAAQATNDFSSAASNYQAAAQIDASFAELQFRWAQCLLTLHQAEPAKEHFKLARDSDSLPFRVDTRLNTIIQESWKKHSAEGVGLVDSAGVLAAASADGIPGKESMYEHVHLTFEGNYRVALSVAEAVTKMLPGNAGDGAAAGWASFEECARQLALTDWDRRRIYESLYRRLTEPPFTHQTGHAVQMETLKQEISEVRSNQTPAALQQAREIYEKATHAAPADPYLRGDFAKLDEDTGDLPGAAEQWRAVRDEIPFAPGPHYYLAKVLGRQGNTDEALKELDAALAIRSDLPEALQEKGKLLVKAKRFDEGMAALDRAAELEPGNARIYMDRAEALAANGKRPEALGQLQRAVALQPGLWEAHYLLGVELAFKGDLRSAAEQFIETVRLNPTFTLGHLNLGIALAKLNKMEEATSQFQETLRLDPKNEKAAEYLRALREMQARRQKHNPVK